MKGRSNSVWAAFMICWDGEGDGVSEDLTESPPSSTWGKGTEVVERRFNIQSSLGIRSLWWFLSLRILLVN